MVDKIWCPLCNSIMKVDGRYYKCASNQLHTCLIDEEYMKYKNGEKSIRWLMWRMKVRLGKKVHQR